MWATAPMATIPTGSAAYQAVLADCAYTYNSTPVTVTMNGLVAGQEYEIEIWNSTPYDDTILTGSGRRPTRSFSTSANTRSAPSPLAPPIPLPSTPAPAAAASGVVDAFEIREIPEPSPTPSSA